MYVLLADVSVIEYVPRKWPPPFKLVWGQVFIKVVGTTNFSEKKKKGSPLKIWSSYQNIIWNPDLLQRGLRLAFLGSTGNFVSNICSNLVATFTSRTPNSLIHISN